MAASLGPSWSLRSTASPRCLTAYVTTTSSDDDSKSSIGGGGGDVSNPFDDEIIISPTTTAHHTNNRHHSYYYSVAFGTERGSLHYRNYPQTDGTSHNNIISGRGIIRGPYNTNNERGPLQGGGGGTDPSQLFIDPDTSTPDGQINLQGAVKGSIVGIVRAHPPSTPSPSSSGANYNNATPVFLLLVDDNRGTIATSSSQSSNPPGAYAAHLVTIKNGSFTKLPAAPQLLDGGGGGNNNNNIIANNNNNKPPLTTAGHHHHHHRRGGSGSGGSAGSGNMSGWFGNSNSGGDNATSVISGGGKSNMQYAAAGQGGSANNVQQQSQLGALPRMSCVSYHPNSGYVYASGTGVFGLSNSAVKAVLAGMMMSHQKINDRSFGGGGGSGSGPFHHHSSMNASVSSTSHNIRRGGHNSGFNTNNATHNNMIPPPPMAIYLKTSHALPLPGVRTSSSSSSSGGGSSGGGSSKNSMTLACSGRVAIVAVTNAFYAVPSFLDVNVIKSIVSGDYLTSSSTTTNASTSSTASLPNVTATKIISFAQSSQVHPVIAMEVITSGGGGSDHHLSSASFSSSDMMKHYLRPITSLVFLASGRECTTIEIVSIPNSQSVSMLNKGGSIVGGGMISTSIQCFTSSAAMIGKQQQQSSSGSGIMATLPSPILAAAPLPSTLTKSGSSGGGGGDLSAGALVALLTVDGLVHIRSPFCVAVPLSSIEVGTRPNDFFSLSSLSSTPIISNNIMNRNIVATSYGGEARLISCHVETPQDFADRLIKLCIDAFGSNGFPRLELAEALGATFSATSYVGPEPTTHKRLLLKQYLESVLGLRDDVSLRLSSSESTSGTRGSVGSWGDNVSLVMSEDGQESGLEVVEETMTSNHQGNSGQGNEDTIIPSSSLGANSLLTCTALLCLVCYQLSPPNGTAACRASKVCASAMGIVRPRQEHSGISKAAMAVCELVADRLLKEVSTSFSLLNTSAPSNRSSSHGSAGGTTMEFVESAVWLLRSCGCHEKAIDVLQERMNSPSFRNSAVGTDSSSGGGGWSQIKFDSYIATHLGELWLSRDDRCCQLVLVSSATRDLIARNPTLGLSVFTTLHPQNETEWKNMKPSDDPLAHLYPPKVVELLKSISPRQSAELGIGEVQLDSGRALAVSYLESALGIATGRPSSRDVSGATSQYQPESSRDEFYERKADMHDELSYLLLEGVISERGDKDRGEDSELGAIYRFKLRRLLSWPNSLIRSERLLGSLPSSFLREHALLLGRMGRHEDALKILYSQENSLELALEYCDVRHERQQAQLDEAKTRSEGNSAMNQANNNECAYIPLVKVALTSDPDSDRGTKAAIQVLALRRNSIDKAAALRLLPRNLPMSSLARPFLIPAVVENESEVRRLSVASSLLRSRYIELKQKLTEAQLKSQASLYSSPALQRLNLGDPLHSSKPVKARPVHAASPYFPNVTLIKHFFPRHLVIQAQVMNTSSNAMSNQSDARTLANVAFVIAESSDEALVPTLELPLKTIPPGSTGSVWCVLSASPQRFDGAAFLTCELRFTVLEIDASTGTPLNFSKGVNAATGFGRTHVEELQDIEVRHTEFG